MAARMVYKWDMVRLPVEREACGITRSPRFRLVRLTQCGVCKWDVPACGRCLRTNVKNFLISPPFFESSAYISPKIVLY